LEDELFEAFYDVRPQRKALDILYTLSQSLNSIWQELPQFRKRKFLEKLEDEYHSYRRKKGYVKNVPFTEFYNTYSRMYYMDIIDSFRKEILLLSINDKVATPNPNATFDNSTRSKPNFKVSYINQILEILQAYFPKEQHNDLKLLIENGINKGVVLDFLASGATLIDFFKQLWKGQILNIAYQAELEKWLAAYFNFIDRKGATKGVTVKYASRFISETRRAAKGNRLIDVKKKEDGTFIIEQLEITNRKQNKNMEEKKSWGYSG
jgi:hypothetical protein